MGGWGYSESPLVDGDKLICIPGGRQGTVAAFDKMTGKLLWRSTDLTDGSQYSSLIIAELGGLRQYVVFTGSHVSGIAPDGHVLWSAARAGKTAMVCTPVIDGDLVFVTSGYGIGCNCFKVTGSATGKDFKAEELYANKDLMVHHGDVVCIDHNIYAATDSGGLVCMAIADGKVHWKEKSVGKGSITFADGHLYARGEGSGDVALVESDPPEALRTSNTGCSNSPSAPTSAPGRTPLWPAASCISVTRIFCSAMTSRRSSYVVRRSRRDFVETHLRRFRFPLGNL